ncbi:MAG: flagellar hook-basal body complex protein, partial [Candidatus Latescibacteria bacterium]|nr:flagellar hook-basal body complex protein [bacterium]MBD3423387.1 flagellar hook-basal body complex protein [Candidatus Latescibacterota bacterium]
MLRGISLSAKAMNNNVARNDVISNNMANVNTTGFKKDVLIFQREEQDNGQVTSPRVSINFDQGPMNRTGRTLDLAINGRGFFQVDTGEGARYTRNGAFLRDSDGYLATSDGYTVAGGIQVPNGDIEIAEDGTVSVEGAVFGRIEIVDFEDSSMLEKAGASLFRAAEGSKPREVPPEEASILSGYIEKSNVDVIGQMTDMISAL